MSDDSRRRWKDGQAISAAARTTQTTANAAPAATTQSAPAPVFTPGVQSSNSFSTASTLPAATMLVRPPAITLSGNAPSAAASNSLASSGGSPLQPAVRGPLEKSFSTNLQAVRVHTDTSAHTVAHSLSTRAVTYGNDIFLGQGERPTDLRVMAHEAAHVVQQRGGPAMQLFSPCSDDAHEHEAEQASAAVLRGESFSVQQQTAPRPQGLFGISLPNPLNWLADKANVIPGFRMFTIILGVNPINMSSVSRSAANILRALIEFLPGGGLITQALDNSGVFEKAGAFVEKQLASLGMTGAAIKAAVTAFISSLSVSDILHLGDVWERAKRIFSEPIDRIISFGKGLVVGIVQLIKDAILKPIARLAEGTNGYALLKAVIGRDPITGDAVPRTAETLIAPFMKLIGQEEIWENMKRSNAIGRAFAWFQGALSGLMGFVTQIPGLFVAAFRSLEIMDIVLVPRAFAKLVGVFGSFLGKFVSWAGGTIWNLLEIIFDVVSPGALGYIKRTGAALKSILRNPLPFVGNLVRAAKAGFMNFGSRFLTHLQAGLLDWLTGSLPGVYIPKALSLVEFGKMALSIFGISWVQIRGKIVRVLGPNGEPIMRGLETTFDVVKALVTGGPAAAWEVIKEKLTNLKDMIVDGIVGFIRDTVIQKAIPKLIAMFIPGAGFISAILSIYDTVMVFVRKISQIIQVVTGFIDSIVTIASGNIGAAAARVERVLAGLLALAINFLAGFLGLGNAAAKVREVITRVRDKVDKAIDTAVTWIATRARALFARLFGGRGAQPGAAGTSPVIARAKQALAPRLRAPAKSKAEVEAVTNAIYSQFRSEGLKTIRVVGEGPHLAVKISASPEETGAVFDQESSLDLADLTPAFFVKTILVASIGGKQYRRESSGGIHAEEKLIADLNASWGTLGNPTAIEIDINRTPCGPALKNCAGRLSSFAQTKNVRLIVRAASPYTSDPSLMTALATLKAEPNIDLRVWDVMKSLKTRYNIDPDDVKTDARAKIENRRKRLLEVREEFNQIHKG